MFPSHIPLVLSALLMGVSPAFAQVAASVTPPPKNEAAEYTKVSTGHDTCATAIALVADDHMAGVEQQYEWLNTHYPAHTLVDQKLIECAGKPTDVMALANEESKTYLFVYFDLSGYFGKGMGL